MDAFDFSNVYRCKECPFITTDSWVCELHKKIRETFTILYGPYLRLNTIMDSRVMWLWIYNFKWVRSNMFIFYHYWMSFAAQFPFSLWLLREIFEHIYADFCTAVNAVCILVSILSTVQCQVHFLKVSFGPADQLWSP